MMVLLAKQIHLQNEVEGGRAARAVGPRKRRRTERMTAEEQERIRIAVNVDRCDKARCFAVQAEEHGIKSAQGVLTGNVT